MIKIYFDKERCLGCHACEFACAVEHSQGKDPSRAHLEPTPAQPRRRVVISKGRVTSKACQNCARPKCVATCTKGAYVKGEDGRVVHDPSKCVSCWDCVAACPFGAIWESEAHAIKCDMCPDLPEGEYACVKGCPVGALFAATAEEYKKIMAERKKKASSAPGPLSERRS